MDLPILLASCSLLLSFATGIFSFTVVQRGLAGAAVAVREAVPSLVGDAMSAKLDEAEAIITRGEEMAAALRTAQARAAATIRHTQAKQPEPDEDEDDGPMGEIMSMLSAAGVTPEQALEMVKGKLGGLGATNTGQPQSFLL